jgi:putative ubiquitin-RnfH superfamily antitoxin RatB of RatAB toxin-antitoxin module
MTRPTIKVEVVFALPERQVLAEVLIAAGATVADAIEASGIEAQFPGVALDRLEAGVWGRVVSRDTTLRSGDRVEIYRPLAIDPKEARRQLAAVGLTMKEGRQ